MRARVPCAGRSISSLKMRSGERPRRATGRIPVCAHNDSEKHHISIFSCRDRRVADGADCDCQHPAPATGLRLIRTGGAKGVDLISRKSWRRPQVRRESVVQLSLSLSLSLRGCLSATAGWSGSSREHGLHVRAARSRRRARCRSLVPAGVSGRGGRRARTRGVAVSTERSSGRQGTLVRLCRPVQGPVRRHP